MGFLSGWNQSGGGKSKLGQFAHNTFDRNNDGKVGGWEAIRTGLSFLSPVGAANNLFRGGYNMYRDSKVQQPGWQGDQPAWTRGIGERPSMTSQFYGGDLRQDMDFRGLPISGGNYAGGSATFNESTGNYAAQPQNNFLSGFNPTAGQYRVMNLGQARDDAINGWLSNPGAASPFGAMSPGDRALANHTGHVSKMEGMRWAGDMNPTIAQDEFNQQNIARQRAAMMYK